MKIQREFLLRELKFVASAAERSSTVPMLTHVLWSAEGDRLTLRATDTQITLESELELAEPAAAPVTLAVPAAPSVAMISEMSGDDLEILFEGARWSARDALSDVKLHGLDPEDFPTQPALDGVQPLPVQAGRLRAAIEGVRHAGVNTPAMDRQPMGFALAPGPPLTLAATDGNRLAISGALESLEGNGENLIRIPPEALKALEGFRGKDSEEWALQRDGHRVLVRSGGQSLSFREIEGAFPSLPSLVGRSRGEGHFKAERRSLLAAVRAAAACPGLENQIVRVTIKGGAEGLEFHARGAFSEVHRRCAAQAADGAEEFTFGMNPAYLADILESVHGNEIQIHYEPDKPMHAIYYEGGGDPASEWRVAMPKALPGGAK